MRTTSAFVLWLFVIDLGIAFGAGVYEQRIVIFRWMNGSPGRARGQSIETREFLKNECPCSPTFISGIRISPLATHAKPESSHQRIRPSGSLTNTTSYFSNIGIRTFSNSRFHRSPS